MQLAEYLQTKKGGTMKGFVLFVCIGLLLSGSLFGTIIHVPGDYPTIQLGLNAASTGDTVLVAAGTYTENIFWPLVNGIKLFSESGAPSTVIDGGSTNTVIYFSGMATYDTTTVMRGFSIRNGYGNPNGGGIYLTNSSPKIANNIIENNSATENGGGLYCFDHSSPFIIGNTIRVDSAYHGGGIYCENWSNPTIIGNRITNNWADWGSGICCKDSSSPVISADTITSNVAYFSGGGIGCENSNPQITNNMISNNSSLHNWGGGIHCVSSSNPQIINNTIINNITGGNGGGITCNWGSNPTITGNTITGNSASDQGGGITCEGGNATITNNMISSNSAYVGGGIFCDGSNPTITGDTIIYNTAAGGGGIYCYNYSDPAITSNIITDNSVSFSGGGISCQGSNPTITNNKIINNSASLHGGGIRCYWGSNPPIRFNTIKENNADSLGDGIYCQDNSFPVVDSNNIYNNGYGAYNADSSQMLMAEYNWWGHSSGPYHQALNPGGLGDSTNMWVDPVPFLTDSLTGITEVVKRQKPSVSMVKQNYPNPFRQETFIRYHCSELSKVTMKVFNILGQEVAILVDKVENAGEHIVRWDAREMSNGIYFYRVTIGDFTETKKCMVVK